MTDDPHIWIEIENEEETIMGMNVYQGYAQAKLRFLVDELAKDGVSFLEKNVPQGTIYSTSYTLRHVGRTEVSHEAGLNPDEGGEYEATVGVRAGTSYHPVYVNRGTGEFGPFIKAPYTTKPPGGLMHFYASDIGSRIAIKEVKGQRAQHFLYTTFRELQIFAQARLMSGAF